MYKKGDAVEIRMFCSGKEAWKPAVYEKVYNSDDEPCLMHYVKFEERYIMVYNKNIRKAQLNSEGL